MIRKIPQSPSKSDKLGESQKWYDGKGTTFFFNPQTISTFYSIYIGIFEAKTIIRGFSLYDCTVRTKNCFNPRTHIGCDVVGEPRMWRSARFNPRTHIGCDVITPKASSAQKFQSTHPHRVRHIVQYDFWRQYHCFNPRTHIGCDRDDTQGSRSHHRFNPRTHIGCDFIRAMRS